MLTLRRVRLLSALLCTRISRALLALTACLLVVMPWTEYFCNFDRFLRGGQDTELGLLAVLTVLCLVLVLFQTGRTVLASLLALLQWFACLYRRNKPRIALAELSAMVVPLPPTSNFPAALCPQLQV